MRAPSAAALSRIRRRESCVLEHPAPATPVTARPSEELTVSSAAEVQNVLDDIADMLRVGVSVDDLSGRLIAYNAQHGHADDARVRALLGRETPDDIRMWEQKHGTTTALRPFIIGANPQLGMDARVCLPLISRGVRTGLLYLLAERDPEALLAQVGAIEEQVQLLAAVLYEIASPHLDERRQRELDFDAACQGDADALSALHSTTALRHARGVRVSVSIFCDGDELMRFSESCAAQMRLAVHQTVSHHPAVLASSVRDSHAVVLLRPDRESSAVLQLHKQFSVSNPSPAVGPEEDRLCTGVAAVSSIDELPRSYRRAVIAAQTAAVEPEFGPIADWDDIGPYQIIATSLRPAETPLSERLQTLVDADPTGGLVDTLEALYDRGDSVQLVADQLHLHRTSLYYRLNKIRDLIGADPLVGAMRLELHLALKARRWNRRPRI
jgi:PucR family transcriptional regulator, proline-responsive transcriptional activator